MVSKISKSNSKNDSSNLVESGIANKSLELIEKLNKEIKNVNNIKEKIKKDVDLLSKKLDSNKNKPENTKLIDLIKNDLIKDFSLILNNLNIPKLKKELYNEFENLVSIELNKFNSQINQKLVRNKKDIKIQFSDLEYQISNLVSTNKTILKKINSENNSDILKTFEDFKTKIHLDIEKYINEIISNNSNEDILKINKKLLKYHKLIKNNSSNITEIQDKISILSESDIKNINQIESKFQELKTSTDKLNKLNNNLKSKYLILSKDFNLYKDQASEIIFKNHSLLLEKISKLENNEILNSKQGLIKYKEKLELEVISIIDKIKKDFESYKLSNKENISNNLSIFNKEKENLFKIINSNFAELSIKNKRELESNKSDLDKVMDKNNKDYIKMKNSLLANVKDYISQLDAELLILKTEQNKQNSERKIIDEKLEKANFFLKDSLKKIDIEKEKERDFIVGKINNLVDKNNQLEISLKKDNNSFKIKLNKDIQLNISSQIKELNKKQNSIENNFNELKKELLLKTKNYVSSLDEHFNLLKEEHKVFSNDKLLYINDLNKLISNEISKVELKLDKTIKKIDHEKETERDFIVGKINSIIGNFDKLKIENNIELDNTLKKLSKSNHLELEKVINSINQTLSENTIENQQFQTRISTNNKEEREKLFAQIEDKFSLSQKQFEKDFNIYINLFETQLKNNNIKFEEYLTNTKEKEEKVIKNIDLIKNDLIDDFKNYNLKLDSKINSLNNIEENYDKDKKDLFNELNNFLKLKKVELNDHSNDISKKITQLITIQKDKFELNEEGFRNSFKEKINNLHNLTKNKLDSIEDKFISKNIKSIENKLKTEKSNLDVEFDKVISSIKNEKKEIELINDNLTSKADTITKTIKELDNKENELYNGLLLKEKKSTEKITQLIAIQQDKFDSNEESFRNSFKEKINNLHNFTKDKLDSIEDKFISKNIKSIEDKLKSEKSNLDIEFEKVISSIKTEKKEIELINDNLTSKADTITKTIEELDNKENELYNGLLLKEKKSSEKVESRLMGLEKQINKRFLDLDSQFSGFKNVLIDEVEDLIREVNQIMKTKTSQIDSNLDNLSKMQDTTSNYLNSMLEFQKSISNQVIIFEDDLNDVKVKANNFDPKIHTINDHINYMKEYEDQLLNLIYSLKQKSIPDNSIKLALIKKGHPRFYISMILENFDKLYN